MKTKFSKINLCFSALLFFALVMGLAMPAQMVGATPATNIVYNAIPSTLPPNMPSQAFQAQQTSEFGDYVHLAGTSRLLRTVTVTFSDWALYSDYKTDPRYSGNSVSWTHPITLNIYNVVPGTPLNTLGTKIATVTQTSTIPWRPVGDPTCLDTGYGAGFAWRASDGNCYNGLAFNLTFDLSSLNVTLPDDLIVGVAYNTETYGAAPIGSNGPYNSLNVGAVGSATVGTDGNTDRVFWNSSTASYYADGGAAGVGIFREDTNWTPYGTVPMQITVANNYVNNGGFNTYVGTSKVPKYWTAGKFGPNDGKDLTVYQEGAASVRITGKSGVNKTLTQTLVLNGLAGDRFTFSFQARGNSIPVAGLCEGQVMLYNGTKLVSTKKVSCANGTYKFQLNTLNFKAPGNYTSVVILLTYNKVGGIVWFDAVKLLK
jgi:hypothetical protein